MIYGMMILKKIKVQYAKHQVLMSISSIMFLSQLFDDYVMNKILAMICALGIERHEYEGGRPIICCLYFNSFLHPGFKYHLIGNTLT